MHALTYLDNEAIEGKHEKGKEENENPILMGREKIIDSIKFSCKLAQVFLQGKVVMTCQQIPPKIHTTSTITWPEKLENNNYNNSLANNKKKNEVKKPVDDVLKACPLFASSAANIHILLLLSR